MARSLPPPDIPGYRYLQFLGQGGYADVYLYQQENPSRQVAIKVLRDSDMSSKTLSCFTSEANAMAALEHPHIARVYSVGVAPDGRSFIVMSYYANGSLATRVKTDRLSVPEVLRIGIQLSSAVETAHRRGLLHRDIKPANVLLGQYGDLGLTDFGIAAEIAAADEEDYGLSVPWTAPEVVYQTHPASPQSDVYSLGTTLWHLLVGRSPFLRPDTSNEMFDLMTRIRDLEPPPTGRPDVPDSVERLLRHSMAKDPRLRPQSALALAQGLQAIEQELRLGRTPIALAKEVSAPTPPPATADSTRLKPIARVSDSQPRVGGFQPAPSWAAGGLGAGGAGGLGAAAAGGSAVANVGTATNQPIGPAVGLHDESGLVAPKSNRRAIIGLITVVLIVAVAVAAVLVTNGRSASRPSDKPPAPPPVLVDEAMPGPVTVTATRAGGQVEFTWKYAEAKADDSYRWRVGDGEPQATNVAKATVSATEKVCVSVQVFRASGQSSGEWSTPACA